MISLDRLQYIIPEDQALANKVFSISMQQITGITNMTFQTFAETVVGLQTAQDLPLVQGLTSAVPPSIADYYVTQLGTGTGPNNTIKITDVIGISAGVSVPQLQDTTSQLNTMNTTALQTVYSTMLHVVTNDLGWTTETDPGPPPVYQTVIPGGYPAAGTYTGPDEAILALITAAQTAIASLQATYPNQCTTMNSNWTTIANQVVTDQTNQAQAQINFNDIQSGDRNTVYSLIFQLPSFGQDVAPGGMRDYVTAVADRTTFAGQCIIASLRQGDNQVFLSNAGIFTNSDIPL